MIHHCPKRHEPPTKVIYQPSKLRYWCPTCKQNWTLKQVALIAGGKQ